MPEFVHKENRFATGRVSGRRRTSVFVPWTNYSDQINNLEEYDGFRWGKVHGTWRGGGAWALSRDVIYLAPDRVEARQFTGGGSPLCEGTARIGSPTIGVTIAPWFSIPSDNELDMLGTQAISRTSPNNPAFDLSVLIGELRAEGLPNLPGSSVMERTKLAKSAGSEYLNVEFGWLPLVRGIRDFAKTVDNADRILETYQRGSGNVIKRNYQWPIQQATTVTNCNHGMTPAIGFFTGGGRSSRSFRQDWFECEYRYYVPAGGSISDKSRRYGSYARKLLGVDLLSPAVLWNLAPWSWAADWYSTAGDVINNVANIGSDGLVLRNGFMMSHVGRVVDDYGVYAGQSQVAIHVQERKLRRPATPYGFGVSFDGLSDKRKAIIAALGMSRW